MGNVEVVKLGAVVVADQARHLLEVFRLELHDRFNARAMRLQPSSDERLPEQASDRLPAVKAQMSRARRQTEKLVWPGRTKPLKMDRQTRRVEFFARRA